MTDFKVIDGAVGGSAAGEPQSVYHSRPRKILNRIIREVWYWRLRRWIPVLVWRGQQVDVTITFTEDCLDLSEGGDPDAMRKLFSGGLREIENRLREMGIHFDTGMGGGGRDWEWDFSLSGPVKVSFRGRARHPEKRARPPERPKPVLVKGAS